MDERGGAPDARTAEAATEVSAGSALDDDDLAED
jgi:hypothetical protein